MIFNTDYRLRCNCCGEWCGELYCDDCMELIEEAVHYIVSEYGFSPEKVLDLMSYFYEKNS